MAMVNIPVEPPVTEYLHMKAARRHIPLNGTFELTPVCNMSCRMCYVRMTREQQEALHPLRTADEWIALGRVARDRGMLYLLLTGGEPFLRSDFRKILSELHQMGLVITINSNGTLINEEVVEWLKETPPVRINITLYGASDKTYGELCRNPHGFTQATRAIRLLKEAGISVKINCSVTPYNAADLEGIFEFCRREQLIIQATSYMFPPLRRDAAQIGYNDRFTPEQAAYYAAKAESLMNGEEAYLDRIDQKKLEGLPADAGEDCMETEGEGIRCRAGKCSFWVTWDGKILPCGMLPAGEAADVFEVGFDRAWEMVTEEACAIRLPARCKGCALRDQCRACAAMVLTESGDYSVVPEYRCRMAHAYPQESLRLAEEIRNRIRKQEQVRREGTAE